MGTRFLATHEADISDEWKRAIVAAAATDAVKVPAWDAIFPKPGSGPFDVVPRSLPSPFIRRWAGHETEASADAERLRDEVMGGIAQGLMEHFVPFTGQSAGLVGDVRAAADVVDTMVRDGVAALRAAAGLVVP